MQTTTAAELQSVLQHYDLGNLAVYETDQRGFCNTSYFINVEINGFPVQYFFRKYKKTIKEEELQFEHSLLKHLTAQGYTISARLLATRDGQTYLYLPDPFEPGSYRFYAIFEFLKGEDKYTWVGPLCTRSEITSSARVLAGFHHAADGFQPEGRRIEARIMDLLPRIAKSLKAAPAKTKHTAFDRVLLANTESILAHLQKTSTALQALDLAQLPEIVIHCDFHPGNLKFQDGIATGVFDFDWSKMDYRVFDVALAVFYFFVDWVSETDGAIRLDDASCFLEAYQEFLRGKRGISPLTHFELETFPLFLQAANIYVLFWSIEDHFSKDIDVEEYLRFLNHGINTIKWLETPANQHLLRKILTQVE